MKRITVLMRFLIICLSMSSLDIHSAAQHVDPKRRRNDENFERTVKAKIESESSEDKEQEDKKEENEPIETKEEIESREKLFHGLTLEKFYNALLIDGVENGNFEQVKEALEKGADVNARNLIGETALMMSIIDSSQEIFELLLHYKADVNAVGGKLNNTALHKAADFGYKKKLKILLDAGAKVNIKNDLGETALIKSCVYKFPKCVALLLARGANVNDELPNGRTGLIIAAKENCPEIVAILLDYQADVNAKSKNHETALINACKNNSRIIIELLLAHGADANVQDAQGNTPLIILSIKPSSKKTIKMLLQHNADIAIRNHHGITFLDYISENSELKKVVNEYREMVQKKIAETEHFAEPLEKLISEYVAYPEQTAKQTAKKSSYERR